MLNGPGAAHPHGTQLKSGTTHHCADLSSRRCAGSTQTAASTTPPGSQLVRVTRAIPKLAPCIEHYYFSCRSSCPGLPRTDSNATAAADTLRLAQQRGTVVVVTKADEGWVKHNCNNFLPSPLATLENIKIVSARTTYETDECMEALELRSSRNSAPRRSQTHRSGRTSIASATASSSAMPWRWPWRVRSIVGGSR